jgi:cysteine desulfurase
VIYLDWNATTPPHAEVLAAMALAARDGWANPASVHAPGRRARAHVEDAREAVAALVGLDARDVTLTSGGTEANNLALGLLPGGSSLVVSAIEHPSLTRPAQRLGAAGVVVEWAPPLPDGRITAEAVGEAMARAARRAPVGLVAVQAVNHETGVVQPIAAIAELAHASRALLHVDAVQAAGRLEPSAWLGADAVALAAHKMRGPKGVGALALRLGLTARPVLLGGAQERGARPGTQDAVACAGLGAAARRARGGPARYAALAPLRDRLEAGLLALGARHGIDVARNGEAARAPHVVNLSWAGWSGPELCAALDLEGVAVSSGAACSAGTAEPSPVLLAMVGEARAASAVRASLGEDTTDAEIDTALERWERVLLRARR